MGWGSKERERGGGAGGLMGAEGNDPVGWVISWHLVRHFASNDSSSDKPRERRDGVLPNGVSGILEHRWVSPI